MTDNAVSIQAVCVHADDDGDWEHPSDGSLPCTLKRQKRRRKCAYCEDMAVASLGRPGAWPVCAVHAYRREW